MSLCLTYRPDKQDVRDLDGFAHRLDEGGCSVFWNGRPDIRVRRADQGGIEVVAGRLHAFIRSGGQSLTAENRSIGMQGFWFAQTPDGLVMTDEPSSLRRFLPLRYRWSVALQNVLLANAVEHTSPWESVETVAPGNSVEIGQGSVSRRRLFDVGEFLGFGAQERKVTTFADAASIVQDAFDACLDKNPGPYQLGLSGGLDSRLVLALLHRRETDFESYTIAESDHPDALVARQIAAKLGIRWRLFDAKAIRAMAAEGGAVGPAAARQYYRSFARHALNSTPLYAAARRLPQALFSQEGHTLIDGGMGEIFRSRYLLQTRLAARFRSIDAPFLLRRIASPDVFLPRHAAFRAHVEEALEAVWAASPGRDIHERIDLYAIRTRLAHFGGPEQRRLDALMPNVSPFGDADFLRAVLRIDPGVRRSSAFVRYCLKRWGPAIADLPLVSHGRIVTAGVPPTVTAVLQRIRPTRLPDMVGDMKQMVLDAFGDELEPLYRRLGGLGHYDAPWLEAMILNRGEGSGDERRRFMEWLSFALAVEG